MRMWVMEMTDQNGIVCGKEAIKIEIKIIFSWKDYELRICKVKWKDVGKLTSISTYKIMIYI